MAFRADEAAQDGYERARRILVLSPGVEADKREKADAALQDLLARIPGLDLVELPAQPRCCGAAGSYFIEQPEIADRLQAEKLDQVAAVAPDLLLTTNIGCRLHLGNGLRGRGGSPQVLHPLALLARQLDNSPP